MTTPTTPTNVDTSIPELWAKLTLREQLRGGFFKNWVGGEGSGKPLIQKTELLDNPGDTIHIQVTSPLEGAGISGDTTTLEGSEENLTTAAMKVIPVQYRHGVRSYRRANKKSIIDLRTEAKLRLAEWGEQKLDALRFTNFVLDGTLNGDSYTPNIYVVQGGSDADDVTTTEGLTVEDIQIARLTMYNNRAKPINAGGVPIFGAVVHPNTLFKLKREDEYQSWVREAAVRGAENPFFIGATAMIDGVVIFEHPNVPVADNAGSVSVSSNLFFGAEAFIEGLDESVSWHEKLFDYDNEFGVAYRFAVQPRRGLEQNSLQVLASADAPS